MARSAGSDAPPQICEIAVAGNPNSGKTTVFNSLTGLRHKVANYAGVTVEKREGYLSGTKILLIDLPGAYSLSARARDEEIARDVLLGRQPGTKRPQAVLLVIDAANLERNLYLVSQVIEFGMPVVIACNMMDTARRRGMLIDCAALSKELGVPVIATIASTGEGIDELRAALMGIDGARPPSRQWRLPSEYELAASRVAGVMESSGIVPGYASRGGALLWLGDFLAGDAASRQSAERFMDRLGPDDAAILRQSADGLSREYPDSAAMVIEGRYQWISQVAKRVIRRPQLATDGSARVTTTDRIDRVLTHRILGPLFFAGIMFVLFLSIFSWAEPIMGWIEGGQNALSRWIAAHMPAGALRSLMTDGVIAGVGAVVSFFPQISILFFCLAVLEDSGYMARAAFIMDRLMAHVGLHGKSFIPLLSSYACAIPGIMATRTIEDRRDRFTTIMIAPLMSCSARLPVYLLLISAVFGHRTWLKSGVMFGLYLLGTVTALIVAMILKRTLLAGPRPSFIMELPPYHLPRLSSLLRSTWDRSKLFLTGAGTTIFCVCVIVWALSYFPRMNEAGLSADARAQLANLQANELDKRDNILAAEQLKSSYMGRLGHFIEPAIKPLGYDWRIGIGILSSFLAREVFVGVMGITFAVGPVDETSSDLRERMAGATWPDGSRILTPLTAIGLMVFYVLACQCVSTLAVVHRETQSWRWPIFMFAYMTVLAYGAALGIHQTGRWIGW
jgi:ferrous iron transport protein B